MRTTARRPMRERRPSDWSTDLHARKELESEVATAIRNHPSLTLLQDSSLAFDRLDFQAAGPRDRLVEIELKERLQRLSGGWQTLRSDVPESDLFVVDELAMRKIVDAGRYAFMLVRDVPSSRWCLWSCGALIAASRVRHVRKLE